MNIFGSRILIAIQFRGLYENMRIAIGGFLKKMHRRRCRRLRAPPNQLPVLTAKGMPRRLRAGFPCSQNSSSQPAEKREGRIVSGLRLRPAPQAPAQGQGVRQSVPAQPQPTTRWLRPSYGSPRSSSIATNVPLVGDEGSHSMNGHRSTGHSTQTDAPGKLQNCGCSHGVRRRSCSPGQGQGAHAWAWPIDKMRILSAIPCPWSNRS
jgi:hypothetical protein